MINKFSRIGLRHLKDNCRNQDYVYTDENDRFVAIALADGVSECRHSEQGAKLACVTASELLLKKGEYFFGYENEKINEYILSCVLYYLRKNGEKDGEDIIQYSSTLSCVLYDKLTRQILYFNLGDGMIIASEYGVPKILASPSDSADGCFSTTTIDAAKSVKSGVISANEIDSVMICSDGAWPYFFLGGRMKKEVSHIIGNGLFTELEQFLLEKKDCMDDYSFISIKFSDVERVSA